MAYPVYIKERARQLRVEKQLSLDEIVQPLALPKSTIAYWIADLPLLRPRRENPHPGTLGMQAKYRRLREEAYAQGFREYDDLLKRPTFRDFVVLYIAEGNKRRRNTVAIGNSDPNIVAMAAGWLRSLAQKPLGYMIQYHADQDLDELRQFWGETLQIDGTLIRFQRKTNSGSSAAASGAQPTAFSLCSCTTRSYEPGCKPGLTAYAPTGG